MLTDISGNRLFRKVQIKIVFPEKIFPVQKISKHAPPHKGFGSEEIHNILDDLADQLETLHPYWEFQLVELAPVGRTAFFVFTFSGYRAGTPAASMSPELATAASSENGQ